MRVNDENVIVKLTEKNEAALEYVIDKYGGLVKAIIRKRLHTKVYNAFFEECLSDVFIAVWNNAACYDASKGSFENWLAGITRYKCLYYMRKYLSEAEAAELDEADAPYEDRALESLIENELSEETERLLAHLSETDRRLFSEIYMFEKSVAEVSKAAGISADTLYNRLSRGRKKLREHFLGRKV